MSQSQQQQEQAYPRHQHPSHNSWNGSSARNQPVRYGSSGGYYDPSISPQGDGQQRPPSVPHGHPGYHPPQRGHADPGAHIPDYHFAQPGSAPVGQPITQAPNSYSQGRPHQGYGVPRSPHHHAGQAQSQQGPPTGHRGAMGPSSSVGRDVGNAVNSAPPNSHFNGVPTLPSPHGQPSAPGMVPGQVTWRDHKGDYSIRSLMISRIIRLLQQRKPDATREWLDKLPDMAQRLEEKLYREATSKEEYSDTNTLKQRLQVIALKMAKNKSRASGQPAVVPSVSPRNQVVTGYPPQQQRQVYYGHPGNYAPQAQAMNRQGATIPNGQQPHQHPGGAVGRNTQTQALAIRQQQQRLLLLRHSSKCPVGPNETCHLTQHCKQMKELWAHMSGCKSRDCRYPHCVSSRAVLDHYTRCKNPQCAICQPVREAVKTQPAPKPDAASSMQGAPRASFGSMQSTDSRVMPGNYPGVNMAMHGQQMNPDMKTIMLEREEQNRKIIEMQQEIERLKKKSANANSGSVSSKPSNKRAAKEGKFGGAKRSVAANESKKKEFTAKVSQEPAQAPPGTPNSAPVHHSSLPSHANGVSRQAAAPHPAPVKPEFQHATQPAAGFARVSSYSGAVPPPIVARPGSQSYSVVSNQKAQVQMALSGSISLVNVMRRDEIKSHVASLVQFSACIKPVDLKNRLIPLLRHQMERQFAYIFNKPVDPAEFDIPDYFDVIKKPMDLGTIKRRVEGSYYRSIKQFAKDVLLVYDNAILYNPEGGPNEFGVHETAQDYAQSFIEDYNKLKEAIEREEDMKRRNQDSCRLCGGGQFTFEPPVYYCNGKCNSKIKRSAFYYTTPDNKMFWCVPCYCSLGHSINLEDGGNVEKRLLEKKKNSEATEESWVQCNQCNRWYHQICAMFNSRNEESKTSQYYCPLCILRYLDRLRDEKIPQPITNNALGRSKCYRAADLPRTVLSDYLEECLAKRITAECVKEAKRTCVHPSDIAKPGELTVRVVLHKETELFPRRNLERLYKDPPFNYPRSFPHRVKCILVFQKVDGADVLFFALYTQSYGSDCPAPNTRTMYIAYLDSVFYVEPRFLRTPIYHELLISTLAYEKKRGITKCFIWACPPLAGDDYILYCHPREQKTQKAEMLRTWYINLLEDARKRGIVYSVDNLYDRYIQRVCNPLGIPNFDGDYWPGVTEQFIEDLEKEKIDPKSLAPRAQRAVNRSKNNEKRASGQSKKSAKTKIGSRAKKKRTKTKFSSRPSTSRSRVGGQGSTDRLEESDQKEDDDSALLIPPPPAKLVEIPQCDALTAKIGEAIRQMKDDFFIVCMHHICAECAKDIEQPDEMFWLPSQYRPGMGSLDMTKNKYAPPYALCDSCYKRLYVEELGREVVVPLENIPPKIAEKTEALPSVKADSDDSGGNVTVIKAEAASTKNVKDVEENNLRDSGQNKRKLSAAGSAPKLDEAEAKKVKVDTLMEVDSGSALVDEKSKNNSSLNAPSLDVSNSTEVSKSVDESNVLKVSAGHVDEVSENIGVKSESTSTSNDEIKMEPVSLESSDNCGEQPDPSEKVKTEFKGPELDQGSSVASVARNSSSTSESDSANKAEVDGTSIEKKILESSSVEKGVSKVVNKGAVEQKNDNSNLQPEGETNNLSEGGPNIDMDSDNSNSISRNPLLSIASEDDATVIPGMRQLETEERVLEAGVMARPQSPWVIRPCRLEDMVLHRCYTEPETKDPDPLQDNQFLDTRQQFLSLCQGNRYQFDQLRRAKHSTMMVLYHLHNPEEPGFVHSCNTCQMEIKGNRWWKCNSCEDFDMCEKCHSQVKHVHEMTEVEQQTQPEKDEETNRQQNIQQHIRLLVHASTCTNPDCSDSNCAKMKQLLQHGRTCEKRVQGNCRICRRIWVLLQIHARSCRKPLGHCSVPRCGDIKEHLRIQQATLADRRIRAQTQRMRDEREAEGNSHGNGVKPNGPHEPSRSEEKLPPPGGPSQHWSGKPHYQRHDHHPVGKTVL